MHAPTSTTPAAAAVGAASTTRLHANPPSSSLQVPLSIRQGVRQQIALLLRQRCQASPEHLSKVAARIDHKLVQFASSIAAYQDIHTLPHRVHDSVRDLYGSVQKRRRPSDVVDLTHPYHSQQQHQHVPRATPTIASLPSLLPTLSHSSSLSSLASSTSTTSSSSVQPIARPPSLSEVLVPANLSRSYARRTKDAPIAVTSTNGVIPMSQLCIPVSSEKDRLTLVLSLDTLGNMLSGQCPFPPGFTMVETLTLTSPCPSSTGAMLSPSAICHAFAKCLETGACKNLKSLTVSGLFRDHFSSNNEHPLRTVFHALSQGACPHLTEFHCAANGLQDYGATAMSLWLANAAPKMQVLVLSDNNIADAGMMSLAWAFSHSNASLTTLRLGQNALADRSAGALAAVFKSRGFDALEVLDLHRNAIKAPGAKCLLQVLRMPTDVPRKLREINIDATALRPTRTA
ncbi:hypothetical protein DYB37_002395 [Aphanomyces astaci]|uniref:Uncharacterized protein n=2 Tax=Aphanomyces astaci TaxID=112090 RepID=A0A3R7AZX6_APHAT|nr:hypothetical protein DYB35_000001 [Aphanomyces astaci]RHZ21515.1 hypothetical protein DYB37_002395 [Aphanomyces astaci]RQM29720.1 hypothetical protein B5M09_011157 [Aphanomyces astaci]